MFRHSLLSRLAVSSTSVPSHFTTAMEMAFYFPNFQPHTHVSAAGIPEVVEAMEVLHPQSTGRKKNPVSTDEPVGTQHAQPRWSTVASVSLVPESPQQRADRLRGRERALILLERGIDIYESLGGVSGLNASFANLLRPLYATRFELLNGSEHLPRAEYCRHVHAQKVILHQAAKLLYYNDSWEKSDVKQIETSCVILAHFIKAFCALNTRPFHQASPVKASGSGGVKASIKSGGAKPKTPRIPTPNLPKDWQLCVGGDEHPDHVLTLPMVKSRLDELQQLCDLAVSTHGKTHPELRWYVPKLQLLQGLLTIPLTGHLMDAQVCIDNAARSVFKFTQHVNPLMDGLTERKFEPECGLYLLAQAEIASRIFDWELAPGQVDASVVRSFERAAEFYAAPFNTTINADGIMAMDHLHERSFEAQAYGVCLASYANFLLNAPRPKATSTRDSSVFLPKQIFSMNPLINVASSSDMIFSDVEDPTALSLELCRRRTGEVLERALQLNRGLFPPDERQNPQAVWTLLAMACMYADTRDYLYATGIFETASKAFVHIYGATSMEECLLHRLRYEFLAGVGSDEEAKTASHEVVRLLKALDALPSS